MNLHRSMCRQASLAVVASAMLFAAASATGAAGGQPLILDTQHGINDGQSGTILQSAPLSRAPMVQAPSPAGVAGGNAGNTQPIIVEPYVGVPTGGARPSPRSSSGRHGSSYQQP